MPSPTLTLVTPAPKHTWYPWWKLLWFSPFDPSAVGIFRISLGLLMVVYFVAFQPNWDRYFSAQGVLSIEQLDPDRIHQDKQSVFYWTDGIVPTQIWWWIGFASALLFTLGFQTRAATILLFVLINSMAHRNRMAVNGEDLVFRMLLFYGCFAPLNWEFSVDRWVKNRRSEEKPLPLIWPVRLMQINICLIYLISLPNKLVDDEAWLKGTAIYWAMTNDLWSRFPWPQLFYGGVLSALFTYGTILVEGLFPILVWFRRTRWAALVSISSLHLGIAVCLQNVTFFTLSMVSSLWVFVPGEHVRELARLLNSRPLSHRSQKGPT